MKTIDSITSSISAVFPTAPRELIMAFARSIIDAREIERKQTQRKPYKAKEILSKLKYNDQRY